MIARLNFLQQDVAGRARQSARALLFCEAADAASLNDKAPALASFSKHFCPKRRAKWRL